MRATAWQKLLPLTVTETAERGISLVCIPDRTSAECELTRLEREFGPRFVKAAIHKDRPSKSNPRARSTYTLRYFVRETTERPLF